MFPRPSEDVPRAREDKITHLGGQKSPKSSFGGVVHWGHGSLGRLCGVLSTYFDLLLVKLLFMRVVPKVSGLTG